jgi:MFS family permease
LGILLITGARLGQTYGYKRLFLIGVATFSLASLLCGLAPDPIALIAARVLQGAGAALMFPQTLSGIQLNFSGAARRRAIGLYAIALSSGTVIGQILGGALISAAVRYLPADAHRVRRRVDLPGVAILSVSVLLVVLPLSLGRSEGWPAWTWLCLAASLPTIFAFIWAERRLADRGGAPLVNVHRLANRPVLWGLGACWPRPVPTRCCSRSPNTCSRASVTARWSPGSRWCRGSPPSAWRARSAAPSEWPPWARCI